MPGGCCLISGYSQGSPGRFRASRAEGIGGPSVFGTLRELILLYSEYSGSRDDRRDGPRDGCVGGTGRQTDMGMVCGMVGGEAVWKE